MMLRKISLALLFVFTFGLFSNTAQATNNDPKDKVLMTILKYVLASHYEPEEINDEFSERVYNDFLENLDPLKRYFLASDIEEFSQYKYRIDDQYKKEDLTFFFKVYERFMTRTETAKGFYKEILAAPFDYDKNETLDVDYEARKYAQNENELIQLWHHQLKFSAISRLHDYLEEEDRKLEEDANYEKKSWTELEEKARQMTEENLDEFFIRMDQLTYENWFATYINTITSEYDPHTTYFDPASKKKFDQGISGKLEGIGARLTTKSNYTKVSEIIVGGPAWKQGELEAEDLILKVAQGDEEPLDIVGMRLDDAIEFIKGKKGTEVRLTVKKIDGSTKVISIIRDVVEIQETFVKSSLVEKDGKKFGVIHLPSFYVDFDDKDYRNCASDMAQEIERLKKDKIEGIVLDLRNNGGGSLPAVVDIAGMFIDKGPMVQVKYRDRDPDAKVDRNAGILWDGPLVVMVNEYSASASEIFAAAMQDYKRAVIIGGQQTFGKGTVQSIYDLNKFHNLNDDIGALKLTIQKFYRINGSSVQLEGVKSDIKLPNRLSYMEVGERQEKTALGFDKVTPANYSEWNNYSNFNEVINNSKKRVSSNKYFRLIDEHAKWLKKSADDTVVYLNYAAYKKDLEQHEQTSKKFKEIRDFKTNLTYTSPGYEISLLESVPGLKDKREAWHKNLTKDIYVNEALNVLSELKIKPEYLLVKN